MAPTILIFSIAMGANSSFELISIVHWVPQFVMHNKSILGGVLRRLKIIGLSSKKIIPRVVLTGEILQLQHQVFRYPFWKTPAKIGMKRRCHMNSQISSCALFLLSVGQPVTIRDYSNRNPKQNKIHHNHPTAQLQLPASWSIRSKVEFWSMD